MGCSTIRAQVNTGYLIWQGCISIGVYVTIKLNGRGRLHGWLLGAAIQLAQLSYGVVTHQWGFLLAALPGLAFLEVWVSKLRERKRGSSNSPDPVRQERVLVKISHPRHRLDPDRSDPVLRFPDPPKPPRPPNPPSPPNPGGPGPKGPGGSPGTGPGRPPKR